MPQSFVEKRPWGEFEQFDLTKVSAVKILTVNPGGELSYQYHNFRDELWIPLTEGLEFVIEGKQIRPRPFEKIFIPKKTKHRARGIGKKPAKWLEFWLGKSDESDIVRLEDKYHRR